MYFQLKSSQNVSAVLVPVAAVQTLAVVVPDFLSKTKSTCVLCGMPAVDTDAPAAGTIIWPYEVKERTYCVLSVVSATRGGASAVVVVLLSSDTNCRTR